MPTLEVITDLDDEADVLDWAKSPNAFGLEDFRAVGSELDPMDTHIDDERWLATIPPSSERSLSLPPVTDGTRAFAHLSGASRMDNSGNTYTFINNYFKDGHTLPMTSFSSDASQSAAGRQETGPSPVTSSASISSSVSESSRSSVSSSSARPTPQHEGNTMINLSADFIMEREDGCYVEPVTPSKGNIPFHPDTEEHIRAYMSSAFNFGETLIPLWKPRRRQFPVAVSEVGMVGDVGYFDAGGGFCSLFNIFLTEDENKGYRYSPPTNFKEYSNFQVRNNIIDAIRIRPREPFSQGLVNFCVHGKFRLVKQDGSSKLSFRSEALVTSSLHGSIIAYHNSILGRLDEEHPPARKECIQPYLNRNAAQWYKYYNVVREQRPPLKNGDLMLVHTSWSTDSWALAAFPYEENWELGTYFAKLVPCSSQQPDVYAWEAHTSVKTQTSHPKNNSTPERSDHCIAVGVNSIFTGDPPRHKRNKMKRGLYSLSQSLSSMSIKSTIANSLTSIATLGRRRKK